MLRRVLLQAALVILLRQTTVAAESSFAWVKPGGLDIIRAAVGSDGRILLVDAWGRVWFGPAPIPDLRNGVPTTPNGWEMRDLPRGLLNPVPAMAPGGMLYVTGVRETRGAATVFRLDTRDRAAAWDEIPPPMLASLQSMTIASDGTVWVCGEWRDLFRLEGGHWIREVTPRPLHNRWIWMGPEGHGWILATSRRRAALYYREKNGWKTVADSSDSGWGLAGLLFATADEAILQGQNGIERFSAPGAPSRRPLPVFLGVEDEQVVLEAPDTGWTLEGGALFRVEHGRRSAVDVRNSSNMALVIVGAAGLFGRTRTDAHWYQLRPSSAVGHVQTTSGLRLIDARHSMATSGRIMGVAILTLNGVEYVYLVDHESYNATIPASALADRSAFAGAGRWKSLSEQLGVADSRLGKDLSPIFDSAALAADLDGDGDEDLVLVTMYDGIRIFRNQRDTHFVPWQAESRIVVGAMDLPTGACLLDADGDGDLDLYVANGMVSDSLWLNNGDAVFRNVTRAAGIDTHDGGSSPVCSDLDGDGDIDVAVATGARGLLVQENLGIAGGVPRFREHRLLLDRADLDGGPGLSTVDLSSLAIADLDGDGLPEIFAAAANGCDRLFRNDGHLRFREDPSALPAGQLCDCSISAEFTDVDGDGQMDLWVAGRGGSRVYHGRNGRFLALDPTEGIPAALGVAAMGRGSATVDIDGDGDPDVVQGLDGGGADVYENVVGTSPSLSLRLIGPPGNGSAVGARVGVRPEEGGIAAWRDVPASSGSGSHSSKRVTIAGLASGHAYSVEVAIPGRGTQNLGTFTVPFRGDVMIGPTGFSRIAAQASWFLGHLFSDSWRRAFALSCLAALLLTAGFAALLFRGTSQLSMGLALAATAPLAAVVIVSLVPTDPGPVRALGIPALSTVFAGALVALRRSRVSAGPVPEVLGELSLALDAFRHNKLLRRVTDQLLFVVRETAKLADAADRSQIGLLSEDLYRYREVVLPELSSLLRLASSAGVHSGSEAQVVRRLTRQTRILLDTSKLPRRDELASLASALVATGRWVDHLRREVDMNLALDLNLALKSYVTTRRSGISSPIRLEDADGEAITVRFLASEMCRVLDILLENALRAHGGDPSKAITIRIDRTDAHRVRVEFHDQGPGIDAEIRSRLFTFGESGWPGGHGFGLYFARRAVRRFGGRLDVSNRPEGGACFAIELARVEPGGGLKERTA